MVAAVLVSVESSVPVAQAWAWWTDFGPVGVETVVDHGLGRTRRTVKARIGDRVVIEERPDLPGGSRLPPFRHSVNVDEAAHILVETAPTFEAVWTFEPTAAGGTRITRRLTQRGIGRLAPEILSRPAIERDLRAHVKQMEKDHATMGNDHAK